MRTLLLGLLVFALPTVGFANATTEAIRGAASLIAHYKSSHVLSQGVLLAPGVLLKEGSATREVVDLWARTPPKERPALLKDLAADPREQRQLNTMLDALAVTTSSSETTILLGAPGPQGAEARCAQDGVSPELAKLAWSMPFFTVPTGPYPQTTRMDALPFVHGGGPGAMFPPTDAGYSVFPNSFPVVSSPRTLTIDGADSGPGSFDGRLGALARYGLDARPIMGEFRLHTHPGPSDPSTGIRLRVVSRRNGGGAPDAIGVQIGDRATVELERVDGSLYRDPAAGPGDLERIYVNPEGVVASAVFKSHDGRGMRMMYAGDPPGTPELASYKMGSDGGTLEIIDRYPSTTLGRMAIVVRLPDGREPVLIRNGWGTYGPASVGSGPIAQMEFTDAGELVRIVPNPRMLTTPTSPIRRQP